MAYVVTQSCCADASCTLACPVNCIHPTPGEPGFAEAEMLYVDPDGCVGCGACATACPVGAIVPERSLRPEQRRFSDLNADYYRTFPHADRAPMMAIPPQRRLRQSHPVRVAVVGAGPAGMYAADELLRHPEVEVDVYDRLPTPYGLARGGVAPDHHATRGITELFNAIEQQPGFRYLLGVEIGRDLELAHLADHYDAVVHAVGAAHDRPWEVPGRDLRGSVSATAMVGWYNSQPHEPDQPTIDPAIDLPLDHPRAVVVGNGNVALDIARILARDPERLARTDIDGDALEHLRGSRVREVLVLGRRGPAEAAFTLPELIGLATLPETAEVDVLLDPGDQPLPTATPAAAILRELAGRQPTPGRRRIVLRFGTTPIALYDDPAAPGRVAGLAVERAGRQEQITTGLVVRAIGFVGRPIPGLPFDDKTGTVRHVGGRVVPGTYVVGWAKRGARGHLGSNKSCASETVEALLNDLDAGAIGAGAIGAGEIGEGQIGDRSSDLSARRAAVDALLQRRAPHALGLRGWQLVDAEERRRGAEQGRPRARMTDIAEMHRIAGQRAALA